jgi:hypothetical protein
MDEGTKTTQYIRYIEDELGLPPPGPTPVYNDNSGSVAWGTTGAVTKKLRHVNIREFRVREARDHQEIEILHIAGKVNPSDIFTKEDDDDRHFQTVRSAMVVARPDQYDGGCQSTAPRAVPPKAQSLVLTRPLTDPSTSAPLRSFKDVLVEGQVRR